MLGASALTPPARSDVTYYRGLNNYLYYLGGSLFYYNIQRPKPYSNYYMAPKTLSWQVQLRSVNDTNSP